MARAGESIQLIIPEGLIPSSIRQTRAITDRVIDVVGFVDLGTGGRELMQNVRDLAGCVIPSSFRRGLLSKQP